MARLIPEPATNTFTYRLEKPKRLGWDAVISGAMMLVMAVVGMGWLA